MHGIPSRYKNGIEIRRNISSQIIDNTVVNGEDQTTAVA